MFAEWQSQNRGPVIGFVDLPLKECPGFFGVRGVNADVFCLTPVSREAVRGDLAHAARCYRFVNRSINLDAHMVPAAECKEADQKPANVF